MEKHDAGSARTFSEARDAVMQDYKKEEQTRVENANLKYVKGKADIQLAPASTADAAVRPASL